MLDKLSIKILEYMNQNENASRKTYDFDDDIEQIAFAVGSDYEAVRSAVRYLKEQEYIKFILRSNGRADGFYLDHKGLHQKELKALENKDFWRKSILTPILVAFATSLVTVHLLPLILKWLKQMLLQLL